MSRHTTFTGLVVVATTLLIGCVTGPTRRVTRVDPNRQTKDLKGEWNDNDASEIAKVMIRDCLARPWATKFKSSQGRDPVVKLVTVRNKTDTHIDTRSFTMQLEQELVNSGVVKVVAAKDETGAAREERDDQAAHASDETKKEHQQETGTDFVLNGWIIYNLERAGGESFRTYQVNLQLINAESQVKTWFKTHKIKKYVQQAETTW